MTLESSGVGGFYWRRRTGNQLLEDNSWPGKLCLSFNRTFSELLLEVSYACSMAFSSLTTSPPPPPPLESLVFIPRF